MTARDTKGSRSTSSLPEKNNSQIDFFVTPKYQINNNEKN